MRRNLLEEKGVLARCDVLLPSLDLGLLGGRVGRHDSSDNGSDLRVG
jgi:hypothetical protein